MANISQINGNLLNAATASLATTASFALTVAGGGGPAFPYTGSARITGSLNVIGTTTITGSLIVSGNATLSGSTHTVRASTGEINLLASSSTVNIQTTRVGIYDPTSTIGVSDHIYIDANTADGGMYWSSNDEVIANFNTSNGRYNYGNNNLYVSSSDSRTYSSNGFVGPLIGTSSWATSASQTLTSSVTANTEVNDVPSNNAINYLGFYLSSTGYRPTRVASTKFVVNPATGSMGINKSTITTGYNLDISGSVLVTGSVSASLGFFGTASYAITASHALNAGGGAAFPFTGSARITGSLGVTGSTSIQGTFNQGTNNTTTGIFSHTQGNTVTASNTGSHAEGEFTLASGMYSHAEGQYTVASGHYSHVEGIGDSIGSNLAEGTGSHAEGYLTQAVGSYSHAEGSGISGVDGEGPFVDYLQANAAASHAEGYLTRANAFASHTEGASTQTNGSYAHAEGFNTNANGFASHTEGSQTVAQASGSHAEGLGTNASGSYQHVQGQYNILSSAESAFIIGNGTDGAARSNLVFASSSQFQITGSLRVSGSITGSLLGTSSFSSNTFTNLKTVRFEMGVSSTTVITTGAKGRKTTSFVGTIVGWRLVADQSTTTTVDIWKTNLAIPTVANSITAAAKPTLTAAQLNGNTTLTGWTTSIADGDVFILNVDSNNNANYISLELDILLTNA